MTTPALFNEYIWLVKTIHEAGGITLADLNEQWRQTEMSGGTAMSRTTFYRHKNAIEEIFGIIIDCDKRNGNRYFIGNAEVLRGSSIQNWILTTLSVSNVVSESKSLYDRILLEKIPSGDEALQLIIKAMRESSKLRIAYRRYAAPESREFTVEPYCVKLFRQRWYMVARSTYTYYCEKRPRIYALDRITYLHKTEHTFRMPDDWDAAEYFEGCFGVIADHKTDIQPVTLKVNPSQANYLRSLPLHESQQETERTPDYSIFTLNLRPTFDFQQELLWNGEDIEVLEPLWLREEIAGKIKRMWNKYKED